MEDRKAEEETRSRREGRKKRSKDGLSLRTCNMPTLEIIVIFIYKGRFLKNKRLHPP